MRSAGRKAGTSVSSNQTQLLDEFPCGRHGHLRLCRMAGGGCPSSDQQEGQLSRASKQSEACPCVRTDRLCALPTWWLLRGRYTRSHSEPGREMPQRRWYFVSRRGRVGRCQVCKTQSPIFSSRTPSPTPACRPHKPTPPPPATSNKGNGPECPASPQAETPTRTCKPAAGPARTAQKRRGVEQPGSSSGS